jgi:hypothetical protein
VGRCLVPASHFFEFTGTRSPKSKWKFSKVGEEWFCFAGLWRPTPGEAGDAFTLLTTRPDVAPFMTARWSFWSVKTGGLGSISANPRRSCSSH